MIRHSCRSVPAALATLVAGLLGSAAAEPVGPPSPAPVLTATGQPGQRLAVDTALDRYATPAAAQVSQTIYLNRCQPSCTVHMGNNDARIDTSTIPTPSATHPGSDYQVSEFRNSALQIGTAADAEWAMVVQC